MIYLEFIERDRAMPIEIFRQLGNQASAWAEGAEDRMILQLGRTLRLGPAPSYLCLWEIPDLSRLDSWEAYFHSPAARMNNRSLAMHRAIHIQRAGLYDLLSRGEPLEAPLHIVEYIDPLPAFRTAPGRHVGPLLPRALHQNSFDHDWFHDPHVMRGQQPRRDTRARW